MLSGLQCRYAVMRLAAGECTEIIGKIVIQHVGFRHIPIDNQFQVVTNTRTRGIDTVFIADLRHEVRRAVHIAAIHERRAVQVAIDAGTDGIVAHVFGSSHDEVGGIAIGHHVVDAIHGINIDHTLLVGVADVFRHGKREAERAGLHTVRSIEERLRAVIIDKGLIGISRGIHFTGNQLLGITNRGCHPAIKVSCLRAVLLNMALNVCHRECLQLDVVGISHGLSVDGINNGLQRRNIQHQSRVAQERILQFVDCQVGTVFTIGKQRILGTCWASPRETYLPFTRVNKALRKALLIRLLRSVYTVRVVP